ncbi:MAG: hypothetical protein ACYCU3_07280 [Streptosporangiaceae bacterium]
MKWSVGIQAESDKILTQADVVELADAVATHDGIATGIGTSVYGAQLVVTADSREAAIKEARRVFARAVARAGLHSGRIVRTDAISEYEDRAG